MISGNTYRNEYRKPADGSAVLQEYRCACGKLLCKGLMFVGAVEIKCPRCGSLQTMHASEGGEAIFFDLDRDGLMPAMNARSGGNGISETLFAAVSQFLRDSRETIRSKLAEEKPFAVPHYSLTLQDGASVPCESYVIPRLSRGAVHGYRVISRISRADAAEA